MLRTLLNSLVQLICLIVAAVVLLVILNWNLLTKLKAGTDLRGFAGAVRRSTLMLHDKERLLDVIEHLEDRVDLEESIGPLRWYQHAEAIQEMLDEGIVGDEVRLIERELERAEGDLEKSHRD